MIVQPSGSPLVSSAASGSAPKLAIAQLIELVQRFSPEQQQQVLDFVEFLAQKNRLQASQKTIWEEIDELMAEVPDEVWEKVPTDGSYIRVNHSPDYGATLMGDRSISHTPY